MMQKYLSISIDDGHPTDLKAAELLLQYGLKATFYIPATNPERENILIQDLQSLAKHFDLGAHTMSHRSLHKMSALEVSEEVGSSKKWLEDAIGKPVLAFCYPQGKFNSRTPQLVEQAGFIGARTSMYNLHDFPKNPYLWGVSTQAYSHPPLVQLRHALIERNFKGVWNYLTIYNLKRDWVDHFLHAFHHVEKNGGIAHLYFHSWEITQLNEWNRLEDVFKRISNHPEFQYVTNAELFCLWKEKTNSTQS